MSDTPQRKRSDHLLLAALIAGSTVAKAAKAAGLSENSAYRRLRDPEFRDRLDKAKKTIEDNAADLMTLSTSEAAMVLRELLKSSKEAIRLWAARAIWEFGERLTDRREITERIAAIEAADKEAAERGL